MTVYRLPAGAVLLDGPSLDAVRYAVDVAQRARRRNGLPRLAALDALDAAVTPSGHTDTDDEPTGQPDDMTTTEAAALLGISERTARRHAPNLGGRLTAGRWLLDRQAVAEHLRGLTA